MMGPSEGKMGTEHGMGGEQGTDHMKMMWEKLDEKTKKMVMSRMLEEKIMMKEAWIKHLQHKIETMKMIKAAMDRMQHLIFFFSDEIFLFFY